MKEGGCGREGCIDKVQADEGGEATVGMKRTRTAEATARVTLTTRGTGNIRGLEGRASDVLRGRG